MTTLTHTHTPLKSAISNYFDEQHTLCTECDSNIYRFWLEFGGDRLDMWSEWMEVR